MKKLAVFCAVCLCGCDLKLTPSEAIANPTSQPQVVNSILPADVVIAPAFLKASVARPMSGDLRPIYIFSGRITNNSLSAVGKIRVIVEMTTTEGPVDSAVVDLDVNIPMHHVQSFAQEIRIYPPPGKWSWDCQVISVEPKYPIAAR
jgi:hypothetical protein